ncbi:MAG: acyl-CoA thioesterase [Solirubrobacteraceae bacterium]
MSLDGFRFRHDQQVVLRDLDGFDHVNNAVYLTYAENARVAYLREVVGAIRREQIRNVMASAAIQFRGEASYGDRLRIGVRTDSIGNRSFELAYRILRDDGALVAEVESVQVMYDFQAGASIAVPDRWRSAIEAYEGRA